MVGLAGLEPATSRLSGVRSNHLSYRPPLTGRGGGTRTPGPMVPNHVRYQTALHLDNIFCLFNLKWQGWRDSNPRRTVLETDALPTELHPYVIY